jgi:hypothetical protein
MVYFVNSFTTLSVCTLYRTEWSDDRWLMNGRDMEGSGRGLIEVLSGHLPGGTEKNHENPHSSRRSGLHFNRSPSTYDHRALPVRSVKWCPKERDRILLNVVLTWLCWCERDRNRFQWRNSVTTATYPSLLIYIITNGLKQVLIIIYWTDFHFTRYRLWNFCSSDIFD